MVATSYRPISVVTGLVFAHKMDMSSVGKLDELQVTQTSGPHTAQGSAHISDRRPDYHNRGGLASLRLGATWQSVKHS